MIGYEEELQDEIAKLKAENEKLKFLLCAVSKQSGLVVCDCGYICDDIFKMIEHNDKTGHRQDFKQTNFKIK